MIAVSEIYIYSYIYTTIYITLQFIENTSLNFMILYARTTDHDVEELEAFYEQIFESCPKIKLVIPQ